jgi:hypothetical protein
MKEENEHDYCEFCPDEEMQEEEETENSDSLNEEELTEHESEFLHECESLGYFI